ncbi:unnamed protein product [Pleuronectes platessa]|uniref:Uncharacterized protein n=1 Tax=Pleuronectes platessa TaxID=8262 RepID=A0A9N7TU36_PLEPL|nr:unnamed protein product [Pleuronectes platessa]
MASNLIRSTKAQLEKMRSDKEYQDTLSRAKAFSTELGLPSSDTAPLRPARARSVSKALAGFIVRSSSGQRQTGDDQEKRLYFETLDRFISDVEGCCCCASSSSHFSHCSHCGAALGSWGSRSQAHRGHFEPTTANMVMVSDTPATSVAAHSKDGTPTLPL